MQINETNFEYDSRIGWSITQPTENLVDFIIEQGWADIRMGRTEGFTFRGPGGGSKSGGIQELFSEKIFQKYVQIVNNMIYCRKCKDVLLVRVYLSPK